MEGMDLYRKFDTAMKKATKEAGITIEQAVKFLEQMELHMKEEG